MKIKSFFTKLKPFFGTFKLNLDEDTEFDYFITFKNDMDISMEILSKIGKWRYYGKRSIRGWSSLSKEKIRLFLVDNLKLKESDFEVINANSDLFRAG